MLLCLIMLLSFASCSGDGEESKPEGVNIVRDTGKYITVSPETTDEALYKNPGKGWILYDSNGTFNMQTDAAWAIASIAYVRFSWYEIETADGVYDFSPIDECIAQAKAHGTKLAFGVMACNPSSSVDYCTPKFILDRDDVNDITVNVAIPGTTPFDTHIVDFTDPGEGYYVKVTQLCEALAERYKDTGDVEYIDIRSYGSWGENTHSWLEGDEGILDSSRYDGGVNTEVMAKVWQIYIDAFKDTGIQLMTAWGYGCLGCESYAIKQLYYDAAEQGVGVRRDGYGDSNGCMGCETLWSLNKAAGALEMPGGYAGVKNGGFTGEDLLAGPLENRASYYPLGAYGRDGVNMLNDLSDEIEAITNSIGYHFTLTEATFSQSLGINTTGTIEMKWLNDATAKLFLESNVSLALLDADNNVVDTCVLNGVDPTDWVCAMDRLTDDSFNRAYAEFRFEADAAGGPYKLAVGLSTAYSDTPDIQIGNTGKTDELWYVIYDEADGAQGSDNYAASAKITASASLAGTDAASILTGGSSFWCAGSDGEQTLLVELEQSQTLNELTIDWGEYYGSDFTISVSEDNASWTQVYGNSGILTESCTLGGVSGKYIRITITKFAMREITYSKIIPETGTQLLKNGSFENGSDGWDGINEDQISFTGGNAALGAGKTVSLSQWLLRTFELTGPGTYELSVDVYNEGTKPYVKAALGLRWQAEATATVGWYGPSKNLTETVTVTSSGKWETYTFIFDAQWEGPIEYAKLTLSAFSSNEINMTLDNITLVKTSGINGERNEIYSNGQENCTIYSIKIK